MSRRGWEAELSVAVYAVNTVECERAVDGRGESADLGDP